VEALRAGMRIDRVSSVYETEPVGVVEQPRFFNLALTAETNLEVLELLRFIKAVERQVGRKPTFRWGPRTVDIDILLYDDTVVDTPEITIPHREMAKRAFVLVPIAEIAPDALHPVLRRRIRDLRDEAPDLDSVQLVRPFS
jgi:2-amino-4-hydroxy-6-hydroxymethyldihydropteridine diphosphokinase